MTNYNDGSTLEEAIRGTKNILKALENNECRSGYEYLYELIPVMKGFVKGKTIQFTNKYLIAKGEWVDCTLKSIGQPTWLYGNKYRIKP